MRLEKAEQSLLSPPGRPGGEDKMAETIYWKPPAFEVPRAVVFGRQGYEGEYELCGRKKLGRFVSGNTPDIVLFSSIVSRKQGEFGIVESRCFYRDLGSKNGTWIGDVHYRGENSTCELFDGDVLSFCPGGGRDNPQEIILLLTGDAKRREWKSIPFSDKIAGITIGRGLGDLSLEEETVSEKHAVFFHARQGWAIMDCGSKNGVFCNGRKVEGNACLNPLDVLRIGDVWFVYTEEGLWMGRKMPAADRQEAAEKPSFSVSSSSIEEGNYLSISIEKRNVWQRFKKKTLLKDIHLTIADGEMVLVLGGSGAGKTTFMNAVMGYEKADGAMVYGDRNIYEEYQQMKYEIGFVPQQDLLRETDSVYETLKNAAMLRLPVSFPETKRLERVEEVLAIMGLKPEQDSLVSKLSGGQRKRLSIAVEFISDPKLFFLDEPDSGLDGIMSRSLMENLRQIADTGKIVMVITHAPDRAADLFHKVVVLAKSTKDQSGHLAFFGTVEEAYAFFDTDSLEGVVRRINRADEGGDGRADEYIRKFAAGRFGFH